jgi:protein O-mannosyl-transferase
MLAKPGAIVVPCICFVLDALLVRRPIKRALASSLCLLIPLIPLAVVARIVQHVNSFPPPGIWQRPFIAADAVTFYLGKLAVPLRLAPDYGRTPGVVLARSLTYAIPLLPLAIAALIWRSRERLLWSAGLIFLLALLPVSGLMVFQFQQFSTVADHYMYVPMLGVAVAAAWAFAWAFAWAGQRWSGRTASVFAAALILGLAALSFRQAMYWRDDFALLPHALEVNPASAGVHNNFGVAYNAQADVQGWYASQSDAAGDTLAAQRYRQLERDSRRRAVEQFELALKLDPNSRESRANLAGTTRQLEEATTKP